MDESRALRQAGWAGAASVALVAAGVALLLWFATGLPTRIVRQAHALPTWAAWVSVAVAVLCLSGFWSGGTGSVAFALWLVGAVVGVLRVARQAPPEPAVPAQRLPGSQAARTPPTAAGR